MKGMEVCYLHGGKTPRGVASSRFKHGRYSKELPDRLLSKYEQMGQDENLLELREEIMLVDTRIGDVLRRVDMGDSGRLWRLMSEEQTKYSNAVNKNDVEAMRGSLDTIMALIPQGMGDWASWDEIGKLLDRRVRLVEGERKRIESAHGTMTAVQLMVLLASVLDIIRRYVTDRETLDAIATDIRARIQSPSG